MTTQPACPNPPIKTAPRDHGAVLLLVLVMAVVLSVVIGAVARYVATDLRYGRIVEQRADRLAAADGGLRYALERLQNSAYAACLTNLGRTGYTIDFPAKINDADVKVTCTRGSTGIGDVKAWAVIVTGEGVPAAQWMLHSQAGGGVQKLLGGPIWVSDPARSDLKAPITIEDGDIWYYRPDCDNHAISSLSPKLAFTPDFRGPICVPKPWNEVFTAPAIGVLPVRTDLLKTNPAPTTSGGCKVFRPGRYTVPPVLGTNTYFAAGNYYFENATVDITNATVTAGWADHRMYGDQQYIPNAPCSAAIAADAAVSSPGATWYLGGSSRIEVGNKGSLEILRRLQGESLVSIQTIATTNVNQTASTLGYNDDVVWTKPGNNSDLAIHGLLWAPRAQLTFGNVTNRANGQLLGGAAVSRIDLQASASASAFIIRVESSPIPYELRIDSSATLAGGTTTMTAVVQIDDQGTAAINSVRVRD